MGRLNRNRFIPWDIARHVLLHTWLVKQQLANVPLREYCECAVLDGMPDCLMYAIQKKCPWTKHAFHCAEATGSIFCLRYAAQNAADFQWTYHTSQIQTPSLEYLIYAMSIGARRLASAWVYFYATDLRRGGLNQTCWAVLNNIPCDDDVVENCITHDNLECFAFMHCHVRPLNPYHDTMRAVDMHAIAIFIYAYKHGGGFPIAREDLYPPSNTYIRLYSDTYLTEWMRHKMMI